MDESDAGRPVGHGLADDNEEGVAFRVERWSIQGPEFEALLAVTGSRSTAMAAYHAAIAASPEKCILLLVNGNILACSTDGSDAVEQKNSRSELQVYRHLTQRERQVLRLLLRGMSMQAVARLLGIAVRTVAYDKYRVMDVNGLRDNVDLMEFGRRHGVLETSHEANAPDASCTT